MINPDLLVLLASADEGVREQLRQAVTELGLHHVDIASSGAEALAALRGHAYALIISDVELGDLDAWRLTRLVRSGVMPLEKHTPVIVVAKTWSARILETTAIEYGVDEVLPLATISRLGEVIEKQLKKDHNQVRIPSLLVIEDNPDIARLVDRVLNGRFAITLCGDGEQGLQRYQEQVFDLVLLDVQLPGISGRDVLHEILARQRDQTVVIMTAHGSAQLAEELLLQGASDFLMKPFRSEELRKVCDIAVRRQDYLISNAQFGRQVKALEQSRAEWRRVSEVHEHLLEHLQTVVLELDANGEIRFLNRAWGQLTGFTVEESIQRPFADFLPSDQVRDELHAKIQSLLSNGIQRVQFELSLNTQSERELWAECQLQRLKTDDGYRITGSLHDITTRKQAQIAVQHLQAHDALTGLPNRLAFDAKLAQLAVDAQTRLQRHALLYLDLDYFKVINDAVGRAVGDQVLNRVASTLQARLRHYDVLCRLGDDEFGLLIGNCDADVASSLAIQLCELIGNMTVGDDKKLSLTCSIGVAIIDGHASAAEYWREADSALFSAKQHGRNRFHVYDPSDADVARFRESVDWLQRARRLIVDNKLEMHVQPVMHLASGKVAYYEALARLRDENGELIPPGLFIPALERAGDTTLLDHAVIQSSMACLAKHPYLNKLAINLSARSFNNPNLLAHIEKSLSQYQLNANQFVFELTESASLVDVRATRVLCDKLAALGCELAVDDFGTGFSTFSYLKELPAHSIKIDGSFIRNLATDKVDQSLVRAITEAARALNKHSVAEYVEDQATLDMVRQIGIDFAQGYFFSKPLPPEQFR